MSKKKQKVLKGSHVTIENAEALHLDTFKLMQKIVTEANKVADDKDGGVELVDKDLVRLAVNFLKDAGIKPMSEFEREQIRLQEKAINDGFESDEQRRKALAEIKKEQRGRVSGAVAIASELDKRVVPESVRDSRLAVIAKGFEDAEEYERLAPYREACRLLDTVRQDMAEQNVSEQDYLQGLPPQKRAEVAEAKRLVEREETV